MYTGKGSGYYRCFEIFSDDLKGSDNMPRTGITAYDLLISCPGDVLQYAEIVKECVESFNHTLGCINNAEIVTRHWACLLYTSRCV